MEFNECKASLEKQVDHVLQLSEQKKEDSVPQPIAWQEWIQTCETSVDRLINIMEEAQHTTDSLANALLEAQREEKIKRADYTLAKRKVEMASQLHEVWIPEDLLQAPPQGEDNVMPIDNRNATKKQIVTLLGDIWEQEKTLYLLQDQLDSIQIKKELFEIHSTLLRDNNSYRNQRIKHLEDTKGSILEIWHLKLLSIDEDPNLHQYSKDALSIIDCFCYDITFEEDLLYFSTRRRGFCVQIIIAKSPKQENECTCTSSIFFFWNSQHTRSGIHEFERSQDIYQGRGLAKHR